MTAVSDGTLIAPDGTDRSRILTAGLVAVGGSIAANLVLRLILGPLLNLDPAFMPFGLGPILFFTALSTTIGSLLFWALARLTARPARLFTIVAAVVFVLMLIPNLVFASNPAAAPFPTANPGNFLTLIVFHIAPALISVWALTRLTRARA
ncbi:MAG TPA: DUF6069 family protein [Chloroflexaceae bacterium]|nr:DUF6069 family protein [Chloroflexaceae bacterium]